MAKNILINIDNSLSGVAELWATQPMANGTRQTAPVFIQTATYVNNTLTLSGLQETSADNSWHYILIIKPVEHGLCSTLGNAQYRFFLPSSVASPVNLTTLLSSYPAWAWAQNGTNYGWVGAPNNSHSVKLVDGVEVARNLVPDPRGVSVSNYRVVGTLSSAEESGVPFIQVRRNLSQSALYVDPSVNFGTSAYDMNVGDTLTVSAEIRVTKAFDVQVRINGYSGAAVSYLNQPMVSLASSDGWVRISATATVSGVSSTGYLRAFVRAFPDNADEGHGFDVRRYMVTLNNPSADYFDGYS